MSQHEGMRPEGGEQLSDPLVDPRAPWGELIEDPTAPRRLLAVMFTDIVGSTELATAVGDKRWRELLEQHDAAIRAQIARFGGTEVDTAGDAFFVTFELPVRAVDCALEAARAIRRLGLRIRAGVHMGECVVSGGRVRGVSVHIGARVAAKARGDELLATSTVRDVLAGAGLKFADRGEQTLKGVEGRWRLYAVEPRERDNEADLPPLLELELAKPAAPWWKRRRVVVAAATALAVLIGAVAYVTLSGPGGLSLVPADSVARIDASSGDVESTLKVDRRPVGLATANDGSLWVANSIDRNVTRVETSGPREGQTRSTRVGAGPISVVAGGRFVFVANADGGTVSRVSIDTNDEVGDRIRAGNGLAAVGYGAGALWVANATDGTLWRVEPTTGKRTLEVPVAPALRGLAVTKDAVWLTSESAGTLTQIDPTSGVIARVIPVGHGPVAVAASARAVWVVNNADRTAVRVDTRSGRVTATQRVGRGARAVAVAGEHVFVANEQDGTISMLDVDTGELLRTIDLHNAPMGLAAAGNSLWVSVRGGVATYRGGTLKLGTALQIDSLDPAGPLVAAEFILSVYPAVYDGLMAFKKVGGPEGNELVPNLAEELRPPTDQGTTYTFKLRSGLRYSDGTPVRASDVRSSFERLLTIEESYGAAFVSILKGADKCSPQSCDLSAGIVTDDRAGTVVFHLRNVYADFPYNLALPSLAIVPGKTPKEDRGLTPIIGTGPYRFATVDKQIQDMTTFARRIVLERNPHFRPRELAQPDGYADRIEITVEPGFDYDKLVNTVADDGYDLMLDLVADRLAELATTRPGQLHLIDMPVNAFVVMNTSVPPFNNEKARRALNYAIDRRAMIVAGENSLAGDLSCQLLPKNTIGYVPYCPYTKDPNPSGIWRAPDLDTAKRLVRESGTAGQRVIVWTEGGDSFSARRRAARAPIVADALNKIGYRASVDNSLEGMAYFRHFANPNHREQVGLFGWAADYAGAANFVLPLMTCPKTLERLGSNIPDSNFSLFCSPSLDTLTERALQVQLNDPARSRDEWAKVDRAITDTAVFVPWGNLRNAFLTSRRAGNLQGHASYLVLLTQMWVVEEPKATPS